MTTILCLAVGLAAADGVPTQPSRPSTSIAIELATKIGPTVKTLAVTDTGLSAGQREALDKALEQTKLFSLTTPDEAQALAAVVRQSGESVLVTVESSGGERLYVGTFAWAAEPPATQASAEETYRRVLQYRRERLEVLPFVRGYAASPVIVGGFGSGWFGDPVPWGFGFGGRVPVSNAPNDWMIVRGKVEPVDELDLATVLDNQQVAKRIEETRFSRTLWWGVGFGAGALAAIGTGAYLHDQYDDQDTRAVATSLVTVGIASGIIALFAPSLSRRHVLSPVEAERLTDTYNEQLRTKIEVSPDDLARFPDE